MSPVSDGEDISGGGCIGLLFHTLSLASEVGMVIPVCVVRVRV